MDPCQVSWKWGRWQRVWAFVSPLQSFTQRPAGSLRSWTPQLMHTGTRGETEAAVLHLWIWAFRKIAKDLMKMIKGRNTTTTLYACTVWSKMTVIWIRICVHTARRRCFLASQRTIFVKLILENILCKPLVRTTMQTFACSWWTRLSFDRLALIDLMITTLTRLSAAASGIRDSGKLGRESELICMATQSPSSLSERLARLISCLKQTKKTQYGMYTCLVLFKQDDKPESIYAFSNAEISFLSSYFTLSVCLKIRWWISRWGEELHKWTATRREHSTWFGEHRRLSDPSDCQTSTSRIEWKDKLFGTDHRQQFIIIIVGNLRLIFITL